ncbi:response regulator transcription factor [Faecalicatena contorta]|uniref:response regulator transcription factor n=1 Tax=Faecalicatena contorta TaxID=39482 RepID=UPI001F1ADFE9|nr:response regulator transcription factor [Faecalicatena contorta]MCF2553830.1 response regulator transcription factor [Faecalicatena contorta]
MEKIAVIEDNVLTGDMINEILVEEGFDVIRAYSGTEALYLLKHNKPDLILLDLVLPGLDGEAVLEHIKDIPVIILSSKAGVEDKVNLLYEGACDYITKPFNAKELIARIYVQLRKEKSFGNPVEKTTLSVGNLTLDCLSLNLYVQSQVVKLTKTESVILKLLMSRSRYTISRDLLLDSISYETPDCTEKSLKQHIYNLRKKMCSINSNIQIETVRGVGFRLSEKEA